MRHYFPFYSFLRFLPLCPIIRLRYIFIPSPVHYNTIELFNTIHNNNIKDLIKLHNIIILNIKI